MSWSIVMKLVNFRRVIINSYMFCPGKQSETLAVMQDNLLDGRQAGSQEKLYENMGGDICSW